MSESHTLDDTGTEANVPGPTRTELEAGAVDRAVQVEEGEDEAGSQPMEPYVGMRFDSLQIAKDHYNSCALRMGFSIKMNTSRWTARTNELIKQQFCCNKFKKPKADDGGAETPPVLDPIPDPKSVNSDEEMEEEPPIFAEEEAGTSKKKKCKRETIKQTECKVKMLVKLIDGRWEVTHFVRDHNHPLVNKPSLSKYLRSHQGISPDEKEFLRILYNCNLTTGDYNPSTMTGRATAGDRDGPTAPLEAASLAQASDDFVPRDPPRSTTKGRAKSRRYKSALELHPKKKNKCSQCQSTEHTAGVCPQRLL
ncbi:hypothetical protein TRIUR3_03202 [Triticum urartu]|uniref:FAR1 domain-containing protein n=1 Tax=Triticum urartu TaxID=4572 RepID=M7Z850_TRIUA|nr:hypothetical protein TRIUR3_03202 [Triticum urartu]